MRGDAPCPAEVSASAHPPTSQQRADISPQQPLPGTTTSTPEQAPAKAAQRPFGTPFGGDILYCRRMMDRITGPPHHPRFLEQPRTPIVFCGHSLCDKLLICSPAQKQQEQGCSRERAEWGAECDPCALPDASHNTQTYWAELAAGHRVHPQSWVLQRDQVQSLIFKVRLVTSVSLLKCCNLN